MSTTFCSHGDIQRTKLGVDVRGDGLAHCRGCGLPVWDQYVGKKLAATKADTTPNPSWNSRDNDLHAIRWMLGVLLAVVGVVILLYANGAFHADKQVCIYYTDGTSQCQ